MDAAEFALAACLKIPIQVRVIASIEAISQ